MKQKQENQPLQKASKSKDFDSPRNSKKDKKIPEVDKEDGLKPINENKMRKIVIEKMILHCGAIGDKLDKSVKLLKMLSGMKPMKTKSNKRIPSLGVRPGLEIGCMVTLRGKEISPLLKRILAAVENTIKRNKIEENHFSFGIDEYIEIPGTEFDREIGILGFSVTLVFARKGKRVGRRKIKTGRVSKKQNISVEEIVEYMEKNFDVEVIEKQQQ